MPASRRRPLELLVPSLVAATVFAFAAGSSSVASVTRVGHDARWVLLGGLFVVAAASAFAARRFVPAVAPAAFAVALVTLAVVSSAWSVSPRLSLERGVSLGLLFAAALLLPAAEREPRRLLLGAVVGAAAVALAGLVLLGVDHAAAVQAASLESPARYRGFGQDANTSALLFGIAIAPALGLAAAARTRRARVALALATALLAGSIVASGSRGGLFAGGVGALVALAGRSRTLRRAGIAAAAVAAAVVIGLVIQNVPKPLSKAGAAVTHVASGPPAARGYLNAETLYPLSADVGAPLPGGGQPAVKRGYFGGSGRLGAWAGVFHQILQRPLLGFGFGTEGDVFVDRYYYFVGGSAEDSYLGISLQLGFVGLIVLLALFASVAAGARRAFAAPHRAMAAACAGAVAAGLVVGVVQSYVYSVGDIGTATFWMCAFLLPAIAVEPRRV